MVSGHGLEMARRFNGGRRAEVTDRTPYRVSRTLQGAGIAVRYGLTHLRYEPGPSLRKTSATALNNCSSPSNPEQDSEPSSTFSALTAFIRISPLRRYQDQVFDNFD